MDLLRSIVGSKSDENGVISDSRQEELETVERLVERFNSASLYEDRRDALRALKALARKYRVEVGSMAMPTLIETMKNVRHAPELANLALDAMCSVIGESGDSEDTAENVGNLGMDDELGERFAEIFMKDKVQVSLVICLLEETEFSIRRPAIHLLTALLRHCQRQVQDIILEDPEAISKIMDLLMERREVLRNDAVLMLGEVTRGNANIQKLIAYENAFEVLFVIIGTEPIDSIVVEDCMFVILNLLKNNTSNQELFREQSLIKTLGNVLESTLWPEDDPDNSDDEYNNEKKRGSVGSNNRPMGKWTNQRVANVVFMFQAIRCLVAPSNPAKLTNAAQKHIHDFGVLQSLCATLMANDVTVPVLAEAICTVAEAMRGYLNSQNYFKTLKAPAGDKSAVSVLLISMASEKQPAELRYAVLYAFQSYLYKNDSGKSDVIGTLLPTSNEQSLSATVGHYLCTMLVAHESLQVWLGAMCIVHCVLDSPKLKEQLLRVQVATSLGTAPASLMSHAMQVLLRWGERRASARAGVLCLLFEWLRDCPHAVACFLDGTDHLTYVTEKIVGSSGGEVTESDERVLRGLAAGILGVAYLYIDDKLGGTYTRSSLLQLIDRRISRDILCDCIDSVCRSEPYVRAAQKPQPSPNVGMVPSQREQMRGNPDQAGLDCVQLDFEFTRVWRKMEGKMTSAFRVVSPDASQSAQKMVKVEQSGENAAFENGQMGRDDSQVVQSYKDLIKRQDAQMAELTAQIKRLQHELEETRKHESNNDEIERLRATLVEKCALIEKQNETLQQKTASTSADASSVPADQHEMMIRLQRENSELRTQVENCVTTANAWQSEATRCQQIASQWQQYCIAQSDAQNSGNAPKLCENATIATLQSQLAELENQLTFGYTAYEEQGRKLATAEGRTAEVEAILASEKQRSAGLEMRLAQIQMELDNQKQVAQIANDKAQHDGEKMKNTLTQKESELGEIRKEQEDLLVLLADQDQKIKEYRRRLLAMGQNVSEDESEPDDQNDDIQEDYGSAEVANQVGNEPALKQEQRVDAHGQNGFSRQHQAHGINGSSAGTHSEATYRYMTSQGQPVINTVDDYGSQRHQTDYGSQQNYGNQPNLSNYFGANQNTVDQNVF